MSAQTDEDVVDLQDLQAQIDLSMSFAQNLVASWVKPVHFAQTSRQKDLEKDLKEYMRRPARLGVGAPIPETQSLAREAAKLKYKLEGGKKRHREEEEAQTRNPASEDDEESRAGAIKKKARVDPFDVVSKKNRNGEQAHGKKSLVMHPTVPAADPQIQAQAAAEDAEDVDEVENLLSNITHSPKTPKKKKKKKRKLDTNKEQQEHPASAQKPSSVAKVQPEAGGEEKSRQSSASPKISKPTTSLLYSPIQASRASPTTTPLKVGSAYLAPILSLSPMHRITNPELFNRPLLNLGSSPNDAESGEEGVLDTVGSPKKKRRRRKKKKKNQENTTVQTEGRL